MRDIIECLKNKFIICLFKACAHWMWVMDGLCVGGIKDELPWEASMLHKRTVYYTTGNTLNYLEYFVMYIKSDV